MARRLMWRVMAGLGAMIVLATPAFPVADNGFRVSYADKSTGTHFWVEFGQCNSGTRSVTLAGGTIDGENIELPPISRPPFPPPTPGGSGAQSQTVDCSKAAILVTSWRVQVKSQTGVDIAGNPTFSLTDRVITINWFQPRRGRPTFTGPNPLVVFLFAPFDPFFGAVVTRECPISFIGIDGQDVTRLIYGLTSESDVDKAEKRDPGK